MSSEKFRIGLVQMACGPDSQANLDHAVEKIREAARRGAQIICLEELFRSQYFCREEDARLFDLAETIPGPSTERLCPLAAELGVVIVASLFERRATGLYHNTAAIIDADGALLGIYRKMHIPDDPLYFEKFYFTPGDLGFRAFDTKFGKIAALVCWDQWYPEAARLASLAGANILFYPTAIGWHPAEKAQYGEAQHDAWRTIQRAHAIANGIYVAAVNRVGFEGPKERGLEFWGASFVSDPFGRVLAEASHDSEEILIVECDPALMEEVRRNWPFLRDRRIDAYGPITSRFLVTPSELPSAMGFRMPAEWEPHEATWIAWPHNRDDWPGRFEPIPWVYGEIVKRLSQVERVRILIANDDVEYNARKVLDSVGAQWEAIEFYPVQTDRVWARDFAPLFVKNGQGRVGAVKWRFNGWAKYENHLADEAAGVAIARTQCDDVWQPELVLEGGSIDVNGAGLLLTTEECLLSPVQARNPELSREEIECALGDYLGIDRVLWLRNGIAGDDTHGHIDDLARFTDSETVVIVSEDDRFDPNYEPLRENLEILKHFPVRVRKLPMPEPLWFDGQRLPASYANFYIANRMVLVPTFNDPNDRVALNILAECFPGREVIGINCVELVWGLGTLHCMTQQQPAASITS